MPVDIYSSLKKVSQWAFGNSILNKLLHNGILVSIVIAFMMIIIVMIFYPAKKGTPFSIIIKMSIYMFASITLIIFLHDGNLISSQLKIFYSLF